MIYVKIQDKHTIQAFSSPYSEVKLHIVVSARVCVLLTFNGKVSMFGYAQ